MTVASRTPEEEAQRWWGWLASRDIVVLYGAPLRVGLSSIGRRDVFISNERAAHLTLIRDLLFGGPPPAGTARAILGSNQ
jgi:hypothetical protein